VAAQANEDPELGNNTMLVGVALQIFTLTMFILLASEFSFRVWQQEGEGLDERFYSLRRRVRFRVFLVLLALSTVLVLIRSIYRLIEMSQGWSGELIEKQTLFFVLERVMVVLAVLLLNLWHPGMTMREAYKIAEPKEMHSSVKKSTPVGNAEGL
jgi:hypothetical protein